MKANEFAEIAESFAAAETCYLLGAWGQELTPAEYRRLCALYPKNLAYNNGKYVGSKCFPFDCICLVKGILSGATTQKRVDYTAIRNCSIGDIATGDFLKLLGQNNPCDPKNAKRGMGLATKGHAAIALGNGKWVDSNLKSGQNGVLVHDKGIEAFTIAGEIPGIDYSDIEPKVGDTIPMVITSIEDTVGGRVAYGSAVIGPVPVIEVGSKVTIDPGAVAGGMSSDPNTGRGVAIDPKYANGEYVDTVKKIAKHYGVDEALLKGINTWVAISSLKLAE